MSKETASSGVPDQGIVISTSQSKETASTGVPDQGMSIGVNESAISG